MQEENLYTPEELAAKLKLSKYTIYEMIKRGDIPAHHIGRSIRVSESQLEIYLMSTKKMDNVYDAEILRENDDVYAVANGIQFYVSTSLEGKVKIAIRPEDIILSTTPLVSSARNVMSGTVTQISADEQGIHVVLNVGLPITALITKRSLTELDLQIGSQLYAIFKSMAIKVLK